MKNFLGTAAICLFVTLNHPSAYAQNENATPASTPFSTVYEVLTRDEMEFVSHFVTDGILVIGKSDFNDTTLGHSIESMHVERILISPNPEVSLVKHNDKVFALMDDALVYSQMSPERLEIAGLAASVARTVGGYIAGKIVDKAVGGHVDKAIDAAAEAVQKTAKDVAETAREVITNPERHLERGSPNPGI